MATRINTKFVAILAVVLVLITAGGVFAVMKLKKSAADHVELAEEAMEEADEALADGDLELAKQRFDRAARNYYSAHTKDALNPDHLYNYIASRKRVPISDLTLAYNELGTIIQDGAAGIHDMPNASAQDREHLYKMLVDWHRMRPSLNTMNPLAQINRYTRDRLSKASDDPIALRYRAMLESYLVEAETDAERRLELLETIVAALEAEPDNPSLHVALGRYHLGNARRQFRANGNAYSDEVRQGFADAQAKFNEAFEYLDTDPAAAIEAFELMFEVRPDQRDAINAAVASRINSAAKLSIALAEKSTREKLFTEELARVAERFQTLGRGTDELPFDGPGQALALAKATVDDRSNDPVAYASLGALESLLNALADADQTIEAGLKLDGVTNGLEFVRRQSARTQMLAQLAEVKVNLAQRQSDQPAARVASLKAAVQLVDELEQTDTPDSDARDARVDLLRGRIELANNKPEEAVSFLDDANQAYNGRDVQTLRYLAEAHGRLRNTTRVIELYESIVGLSPTSPLRLTLANLYLSQGSDQAQLQRAEGHLRVFMSQYPNNLSAVRMMANLMVQRGETENAIALLREQDLEANPELQQDINRYLAITGNTEGLVDQLRNQIAAREAGTDINLGLVTRLINAIPERDDKLAELAKLQEQGLDEQVTQVMRDMIETGQLTLENELKLIEQRDLAPAEKAIAKVVVYSRRGQIASAREQLDQALQLDADLPAAIEWRYRLSLIEQKWDEARAAIDAMMSLGEEERTELAIAGGVFMRARLVAAQASVMPESAERDATFRQAAQMYDQALDTFPFYADGWNQLGRIQLVQENFFAAQNSFREALELQSNDVETLENMARAQVGSGELAEALDRYLEILRLNANHPTALDQYAATALRMDMRAEAISIREQFVDRRPNDADNRRALALLYAQNEEPAKAKSMIDTVIAAEGETIGNVVALSQILLIGDQQDAAIQVAKDYLEKLGEDAGWRDHLLLAELYERSEQPELAEAQFEQAIAKQGEATVASLAWAQALVARGEAPRASMVFQALSEAAPENNQIKAQAASLLIQAEEYEKGEAIAMQLPETPQRYQLLIQSAIGQQKLGIAIQRARNAVDAFGDSFPLKLQLGRLLLAEQARKAEAADRDFSEAQSLSEAIVAQYPEQVDALVLLADIKTQKDQQSQAVEALEQALAFAPTHVGANERLFNLRFREAQSLSESNPQRSATLAESALDLISTLIVSRPNLSQLHRSAGAAAGLAGRRELAVSHYREAYESLGEAVDLQNYASSLLEIGRASEARAILENVDNANFVAERFALRAMRGRALAGVGETAMATRLFDRVLNEVKDDRAERGLVMTQAALSFADQPQRVVELAESVFGQTLPSDIESTITAVLLRSRQFEAVADRLAKFEDQPVDDPQLQVDLLLRLALARQESDQLEKAKATYEKALKMIETKEDLVSVNQRVQLLNNMAFLLADQLEGYEKQAVVYARQAVELIPENESRQTAALIKDTLGWALYKAGEPEAAIRQLERSIEQMPLSANQLHLGRIYLSRGDNNRALLLTRAALDAARAERDPVMIEKSQMWFDKALEAGEE